jgi:hypothetical protein
MNLEIEQIEELLRGMRPRAVSEERKRRIDTALTQAYAQDPLRSAIASTRPSPLSTDLAKRLEESLSRIPHPDTRKVVHFPAHREKVTTPAWRKLAAVAAVAMLGATSALLIPYNATSEVPMAQAPPAARSAVAASINADSLVPAGYRRGLSEAKDEGIVWQPHYGPHRRLKLIYRELVTQRDASGRIYQVERPRVEYVLVPAKVD